VTVAVEGISRRRRSPDRSFITHELDARTDVSGAIRMFDSNGSESPSMTSTRTAVSISFANLDGPDSILWNDGAFAHARAELADFSSQAVNTVDVDGDGRLDIVFTHRAGGVSLWRNVGHRGPAAL
jgi:hypothetical protein